MSPDPQQPASPTIQVACLCAAWCRTCDSYRPTLDTVAAEFSARGLMRPPRWIDIEDEAALVDDVDIETFPTLLIYDAQRVLFAGPLTPQPETLRRLLANVTRPGTGATPVAAEIGALVARLRRAADGP